MPMEIKIDALNMGDFARQVAEIHDRICLGAEPAPVIDADSMPLQDLIEITVKRAKAAGFNVSIADPDIMAEAVVINPDKKSRRKKAEPAEPAPEPSIEEADKPAESSYNGDLDELKSEVIAKCSQLMLDGRRDVVMSLKKQFGRTLSDLPAEEFPAIAARLEEILDGPSDE